MGENLESTFNFRDKVVYVPNGRVYDFGYMGVTGKAIIYEEGETNMQDCYAVGLEELRAYKKTGTGTGSAPVI